MSPAMAMILIIASFLIYHAVTHSLRADLDSLRFLLVVYAVSLLASAGLALTAGRGAGIASYRPLDWALAVLLGLALVGIEYGFIAAYRAGWSVAIAPTFANVALAVLMLPVAMLLLGDRPSLVNMGGLFLCVIGLVLMTRTS